MGELARAWPYCQAASVAVAGFIITRSFYAYAGCNMTYRVYLRWPAQKVTDKTVTESRSVAELAYKELVTRTDWPSDVKPLGVAFTEDGKQLAYYNFVDSNKTS
jgi:hypothetical protein